MLPSIFDIDIGVSPAISVFLLIFSSNCAAESARVMMNLMPVASAQARSSKTPAARMRGRKSSIRSTACRSDSETTGNCRREKKAMRVRSIMIQKTPFDIQFSVRYFPPNFCDIRLSSSKRPRARLNMVETSHATNQPTSRTTIAPRTRGRYPLNCSKVF